MLGKFDYVLVIDFYFLEIIYIDSDRHKENLLINFFNMFIVQHNAGIEGNLAEQMVGNLGGIIINHLVFFSKNQNADFETNS